MPRRVDHEARRHEIVLATWRLIAERGIEATTMRELARELGLANGSVTHYFPDKSAIITAAFAHVFDATTARFEQARARTGGTGLAALRAFLLEAAPIDEERALEARIVIAFLEYAAADSALAEMFRGLMRRWQEAFAAMVVEAQERGEVRDGLDVEAVSDAILHAVNGMQANGVLLPETAREERMRATVDALVDMLR
ncbi:transcriptional regulator, TetR family [Microbacterium sp. ru370.1]|uniref:TetR/AcrR family transcriptional regulator n=1 Tax=unclassified Microbacterium TaxID=2609290 RepID=UPI000881041F|nr:MULTISPECIES: TetR family transcriptional regulator C-terminal domain-containing protein [unclassified Microbacterium]SDO50973.1 transcriptional regulator, TetR family [Microbacterium sp. ru370.1]SIT83286.1 transcriptional regulator, TetR family [Microbacterium sp. RU1D]